MAFPSLDFDLSNVDINLLHLLPGDWTDPIVCTIHTVPLNSKPGYETISYVWGDQSVTRPITCGGSAKQVTESLYLALSRLRLPDRVRTLWIDQLCIDQSNELEKSRQVSVMSDIYSKSSHGLIWLGELPTEEEAGSTEDDVATAFRAIVDVDHDTRNEEPPEDAASRRRLGEVILTLMGSSKARWQGVKWWQRIWTIQEAKLPAESSVIWGRHSLPFYNLKGVAVGMLRWETGVGQRLEGFFALGHLLNELCIPMMNLQINDPAPKPGRLHRWRYRKATNPLDKVYGLMGLFLQPAFESVPFCDYTLSASELYSRATFDLIRDHKGLLPLCGRRGEPRMTEGLPTWAVDWTFADDPMKRTTDCYGHCWRYGFFQSADNLYADPELTSDGAGLVLQGIKVDHIAVLGSVNHVLNLRQLTAEEVDMHIRHTLNSWTAVFEDWQSARPSEQPYIGSEAMTPLEAFRRVLIGDLIYQGSEPHHRASQDEVACIEDYMLHGTTTLVASSVRDMARSQAFFITESGYFGIGPPDAEVGDEVWILCGNVPHVLRRRKVSAEEKGEGEDGLLKCPEFEHIGDAYVQGIMDGELIGDSLTGLENIVLV
ncbi:hypothetical protein ACJ41O_014224 [Fusarium nematophilum]